MKEYKINSNAGLTEEEKEIYHKLFYKKNKPKLLENLKKWRLKKKKNAKNNKTTK